MKPVLLVIDVQNDYFPGGAMELYGAEAAGKVVAQLQAKFRTDSLPVINVQHVATGAGATFFRPNTEGVEIHASAKPADGELVITKHHPNAFRQTQLLGELQEIGATELVIAGMMTHMCIDTTVRAAADLGFSVTLVEDACATKDLEHNGNTVKATDVQTVYLAAIDGSFATVVHSSVML